MRALQDNEIGEWYRHHGLEQEVEGDGRRTNRPANLSRFSFHEQFEFNARGNASGLRNVADKTLRAAGSWDECLLVMLWWGVWPSAEDWPRFYGWRGTHGVRSSLEIAPGHLFSKTELPDLGELLNQVFEFGWECHVFFVSEDSIRSHVFVSHDGWLKMDSDSELTL